MFSVANRLFRRHVQVLLDRDLRQKHGQWSMIDDQRMMLALASIQARQKDLRGGKRQPGFSVTCAQEKLGKLNREGSRSQARTGLVVRLAAVERDLIGD